MEGRERLHSTGGIVTGETMSSLSVGQEQYWTFHMDQLSFQTGSFSWKAGGQYRSREGQSPVVDGDFKFQGTRGRAMVIVNIYQARSPCQAQYGTFA
jgi:hypothetical protein